ncbi:uncharacterized protein LOC120829778 isoform X2 [Gasterosteus aculeatus]
MSQKHSKSKLKRNKSSFRDEHPAKTSPKRSALAPTAETGRSAWWRGECLPVAENLWALTLKSALPDLGDLHWDPVPDLPHPSAAAPPMKLDEELWWCELSRDVAPLPGPDRPATPPPSHSGRRGEEEAPPLQALPQRPRPSSRSSSPGPSTAGGHERRTGAQQEEGAGPLSNQEASRGSLQEEGLQPHVAGGGGGGRLQSCPMCLVMFPDGFTQMDCDGHLAQCLSEVNVDVTW